MPFVPDNSKPTPGFVPDNAHTEGESQSAAPTQNQGFVDNFKNFRNLTPDQVNSMVTEGVKHPMNPSDDPVYAYGMGLASPGVEGSSGMLSRFLRKGGDVLMQKAMGASKYIPGLGEDFAKAGMWGTKAGMTNQATQGMETAGQTIGDLASKIPGTIPQDAVANKVAEIAYSPTGRTSLATPSGYIRPEEQAMADKAISKATEFAKGEPLTGEEMAARRAQAGRAARQARGYTQTPATTLKAQQAVAEQAGYSEALKNAYGKAFPGSTNALADADKQYSTFARASDTLNKPENMGTATNFLSQFLPTTLAESVAGRAAIGAGKVAQKVPEGLPQAIQQAPTTYDQLQDQYAKLRKFFSPKDGQ